jgi:hypothetical protein
MNIHDLLRLRNYLSIAEHRPGRVRITVNPRILAFPHLAALRDLGRQYKDETLVKARFNLLTLSLDVAYDDSRIRPDLIDRLLGDPDEAKVLREALEFAAALGIDIHRGSYA